MSTYTILLEYLGGTYVAQVRASEPSAALVKWLEQLKVRNVAGLTPAAKSELMVRLKEDQPIEIEGCRNVWCSDALLGKNLVLVNIVKTAD